MALRSRAFPLRGGVGIGVRGAHNTAGTLGGFLVDDEGRCYILSTQDVLHPPEMLAESHRPQMKNSNITENVIELLAESRIPQMKNSNITENVMELLAESHPPQMKNSNITENVIEQPAKLDYDTMLHEARKSLNACQDRRSAVERWSTLKKDEGRFERLIKRSEKNIKEVKCMLDSIESQKPREIGEYVCGMRDNFDMRLRGDKDHFFVNAAIAKLEESEVELMRLDKLSESYKTNYCPLYGFENTVDFSPNGEVIDLENIVEEVRTQDSEMRFMKIGRTTGYTSGSLADTSMSYFKNYPHAPGFTSIPFKNGDGAFLARNCFLIRKRMRPFCEGGDEGALVFGNDGRAWGLIVGTFILPSLDYEFCLASPLSVVLKALEKQSGIKGLKLWCVKNEPSGPIKEPAPTELSVERGVTETKIEHSPLQKPEEISKKQKESYDSKPQTPQMSETKIEKEEETQSNSEEDEETQKHLPVEKPKEISEKQKESYETKPQTSQTSVERGVAESEIGAAGLDSIISEDGTLKNILDTSLKSIHWVESYKTGLVITCKDGAAPSMADLRRELPNEVIPYIQFTQTKQWEVRHEKDEETQSYPEENEKTQQSYSEEFIETGSSDDDDNDVQGAGLDSIINKDCILKDIFDTSLKSIHWVESYKTGIVITCKDGAAPSMADLRKKLPEKVLPYIEFTKSKQWEEQHGETQSYPEENKETQQSSSEENEETQQSYSEEFIETGSSNEDDKDVQGELSWFEKTLLDEDFDLEVDCEKFLLSLDWVQDFYIAPSEENGTFQLFITCKKNEVPCMAELKKEFKKDIVYFVEFILGTDVTFEYLVSDNDRDNASSTTTKKKKRGKKKKKKEEKEKNPKKAMSGHAIYIDGNSPGTHGSLGIFVAKVGCKEKHFATTCYHVSSKLPFKDRFGFLAERHQELVEDSNNIDSPTRNARYRYICREEKEGMGMKRTEEKKQEGNGKLEDRIRPGEKQQQAVVEEEGNSNDIGNVEEEKGGRPEEMKVDGNGENERGSVWQGQGKENVTKDNLVPEETTNEEVKVEEEEEGGEEGGEEKGKSIARNENMLGKFSWGICNEQHDISLIELEQDLNFSCTMRDIEGSELPTKYDIASKLRDSKGGLPVEKDGTSTGITEGILFAKSYTGRNPRFRKCFLVKSKNPRKPFAAPGDSGAVVKLALPDNRKCPFAYIVLRKSAKPSKTIDEEKMQYVCFSLQDSLNEYKDFESGDIRACLNSCAAATTGKGRK